VNSKIFEFNNDEFLFVLTQFSHEYAGTLYNKYGATNVQTIDIDNKKKLDLFSFHYPNKVDDFSEYFNSYVDNLVDFLKSSFGIHQDDLFALKRVIIHMFDSKNLTSKNEPRSSKITFLYNDFCQFIGLEEQHLASYFSQYETIFLTKEDAVKYIFNSSISLEKFHKKTVLINLYSVHSDKYNQLYLSFLMFEIQILNLGIKQKTNIVFDDVHHSNNLFYFFEQERFSNMKFYFVSQSTPYLRDLYKPEDNEQDFYFFKLKRLEASFYSILPKNKKNEFFNKISTLRIGEYYSNRDEKFLKFELN
jgi:hypothetical protein